LARLIITNGLPWFRLPPFCAPALTRASGNPGRSMLPSGYSMIAAAVTGGGPRNRGAEGRGRASGAARRRLGTGLADAARRRSSGRRRALARMAPASPAV